MGFKREPTEPVQLTEGSEIGRFSDQKAWAVAHGFKADFGKCRKSSQTR